MSNFYYCNNCNCPTDIESMLVVYETEKKKVVEKRCSKCASDNWHAEIDMGKDGYKQVREKE